MTKVCAEVEHGRSMARESRLAIICLSALASMACTGPSGPSEGAVEASPSAQAVPVSGRAALCEKLRPAVAETIGIEITAIDVMDDEDLPLRCIYNPSDPGPWFEISDTPGNLEEQRAGTEKTGGKTHELPELGPGAFGAKRFGQHMVIANKNNRRILVVGNHTFEQLQAMWLKVADEL